VQGHGGAGRTRVNFILSFMQSLGWKSTNFDNNI